MALAGGDPGKEPDFGLGSSIEAIRREIQEYRTYSQDPEFLPGGSLPHENDFWGGTPQTGPSISDD